jgi:hypothetical protein
MSLAEVLAAIAEELERTEPVSDAEAQSVRALEARVARIVLLLVGRGLLSERDARLLERVGQASRPRVALAVVADKHAVASPDIDCAARLPLCRARCCSFRVMLSPADVREGRLRWQLEEPYVLERGEDGYCSHLRDDGAGCACYADRPATCREYDCREDPRVWVDFARGIPAPMPEHVRTPRP